MSARLEVVPTALAGLQLVERHPIGDSRGSFERLFCDTELAGALQGGTIRQVSRSHTAAAGTVRGMHYQRPPHAEIKLVSCLKGRVFDVAVDLRRHSPTFLRWHAEELSADNHRTLLIPKGFAHGFQTLDDDTELLYLITWPHAPAAEGGVHPGEPRIGIRWPRPLAGLSARDAAFAPLDAGFAGLEP